MCDSVNVAIVIVDASRMGVVKNGIGRCDGALRS